MTNEEREILLEDLCSRLPYGVMVHLKGEYKKPHRVTGIDIDSTPTVSWFEHMRFYEEVIGNIKPYLRPLSDMTQAEDAIRIKLGIWCKNGVDGHEALLGIDGDAVRGMRWLLRKHFDVNGLIPMGLALEAKDLYETREV